MEDLNKKVTLYCDRCGNDQFYFDDINNSDVELMSDDAILKCSDCGKIFTKEELIDLNTEVITANVEDMQEEITLEVQKEITKLFKEWRKCGMNINYTYLTKIGIEILEIILRYVIPIGSFVISVIALKHSNDTMNVRVKFTEMQKKIEELNLQIKQNQLEKIKAEQNRVKKAKIEARVINVSSGNYKLKVWNSGDADAYNVNVMIPEEYQIIILNETMPFERLNVNKSFEEIVVIHLQSSKKFKMILTWEDKDGNKYNDEIIETY